VLEGRHPGIAGELPPAVEDCKVLGVDQEGGGRHQADADDRLSQSKVVRELLILLDGGLHLFLGLGDLLLDELDLFLGKPDDERIVDQMGSLPQTANGVLQTGSGFDQPIAEGHQVLQPQKAVRGQVHGLQKPLVEAGELGDPHGIDPVVFASGQAHAPFQLQGADHRVGKLDLLQKTAQGQREVARVLHAQKAISGLGALLFQPAKQLLEAGYGVGKLLLDELVRAIGPADGRVKGSLGDVDSNKKLLIHGIGGLGEKSRAEFTGMLIPLISLMLNILNGNRPMKRSEGLIPRIVLIDRRPHSSPLTPSTLLALYF